MANNTNLHLAKKIKNDEFYTKYDDIEKELQYYEKAFNGKIVYCNCDNPRYSAFWKYFHLNFKKLGLKSLLATHYQKGNEYSTAHLYTGNANDDAITIFKDGDFRSHDCLNILDKCDIVCSNPPFSLAHDYLLMLLKRNKPFLIIGDINMLSYVDIFPYIRDNKMWLGNNPVKEFVEPNGNIKKFGNKIWLTNIDIQKKHKILELNKTYDEKYYKKYDNFDAINVDRIGDIPKDYNGIMGVPLTFLNVYNPEQFEIITLGSSPKLFTATKRYENLLRHNIDGTTTKEHICCNQCLTIAYDIIPDRKIYFTASNSDKYLVTPYKRLLIRRR